MGKVASRYDLRSLSEAVACFNPDHLSAQYVFFLIGQSWGRCTRSRGTPTQSDSFLRDHSPIVHSCPVRNAEVCVILARIVSNLLLS